MEFIAFDLETTGLGEGTEIVQYAFVKFRDGQPVEVLTDLVKPSPAAKWEKSAIELHGIQKADVKNCLPLHEHISGIAEYIEGRILVAHNAAFDVNRFVREAGLPISAYCSRNMSREYLPGSSHKLDDLSLHFGIDRPALHEAEDDSTACGLIVANFMNQAGVTDVNSFRSAFAQFLIEPKDDAQAGAFTIRSFTQRIRKEEYSEYSRSTDFGRLSNDYFTGMKVIFSDIKGLKHGQAQGFLLLVGGYSQDNVAHDTDYLVVPSLDAQTTKMQKAEYINSRGGSIEIIDEATFIEMIEETSDIESLMSEAYRINL